MNQVFPPRVAVTAPIHGVSQTFPVGRLYCVGRNYAAHAREMGRDPDREPPFFFCKDADALIGDQATIPYPPMTANYHHEIELVVAIGRSGFKVPASAASGLIYGYAVGLDMTRRDLQFAARDLGRPWDAGKNFPYSAPMAPIHRVAETGLINSGKIELLVNDTVRQTADITDLIWSVDEVIEHLSAYYRLMPGDLIFTGTPAGVGPVVSGDRLVGSVEGLSSLSVTIGPPET